MLQFSRFFKTFRTQNISSYQYKFKEKKLSKINSYGFSTYIPRKGVHKEEIFFWEMISTTTVMEAIRTITKIKPQKAEELRFALFHINTFPKDQISDIHELQDAINWLVEKKNLINLFSSNEEFMFTIISFHKMKRQFAGNFTALRGFILDYKSIVSFEAFKPNEFVSILVSLAGLFEGNEHELNEMFSRLLLSAQNVIQFCDIEEIIILTKLFSRLCNKNYSLGENLVDRWEFLNSKDRSQWVTFLGAVYKIGFFEERFFSQGIQYVLKVSSDLKKKKISDHEKERPNSEDLLNNIPQENSQDFFKASVNECIDLLEICIDHFSTDLSTINALYSYLFKLISDIEETSFLRLWELVARLSKKNHSFNFDSTFDLLKRGCLRAHKLSLAQISPASSLKILQSLEILRVEDVAFVQLVLDCILKKIDQLSNPEILLFFRTFYTFSKMFEVYYLKIHDEILRRLKTFDMNQLHSLKDIFVLKKRLFDGSLILAILGLENI